MKKSGKAIGGSFNLFILLCFTLLILIKQIVDKYDQFYLDFWKTLCSIVFVTTISSICIVFVLKAFTFIIKKTRNSIGAFTGACYSSAGRGIVTLLDHWEVW